MANKTEHSTSYTRTKNEGKARKHIKRESNRKMRREWLTEDERNARFNLNLAHVMLMDEER